MSTLRYSRREIGSSPAPAITKWSDNEPLGRGFRRKQRVSKSPTQNPKSPKPKISLTRLTPIASSDDGRDGWNRGTPTNFTLKDLNRVASSYPWPEGVTLCLPVENAGSLAKYPDSLVVHEASLKAGFRVPVPEFVRDFLSWTRLCPAQISPNSWRCISAYGIRCWEVKKAATFVGMKYLFGMREKEGVFNACASNPDVMPRLSSGLRGWKNKWFLVRKGGGYDFDFPVHPGIGVKFSKGASEIMGVSGEEKELMDAFVSLEWTNRNGSEIVTEENLEKAGLSLLHPRQSKKHGKVSSIKFIVGKRNGLNASKSVGASRKRALASRSMCSLHLEKDEERPTKKRFNSIQLTPESSILKLHMPTDSPDGRPNNLASSLTLEEANGLFKEANVNVEQASAEFSRAVTLQVYHANKLIEKHEKLLSSHLASHAKLEGLQEENKELKKELLCARESAKRSEESMTKKIQSLEEELAKTEEKNAERCHKIIVLETDLSKAREKRNCELLNAKLNEEKMKNKIESLEHKLNKTEEENANNLNKAQEENGELCRKVMELETDLLKMIKKGKEESQNEETMKKQIQSLEGIIKKARDENDEQRQTIMKVKSDLSKAKDIAREELLDLKRNVKTMKKQFQMLENKLKKTEEENIELCQKIKELEMDLSEAKDKGRKEFLDSNDFNHRVPHFNSTYYESGIRVGVCQAVRKYQHLDPRIVEFEPDLDDDCGYEVPDPPPYSSPIRLVPNK